MLCFVKMKFLFSVPLGLLARYLNIIVALDKVLKAELLQGCRNMTELCYDPPFIKDMYLYSTVYAAFVFV